MKIQEFILTNIFWPRLKQCGALVVYDHEGRYKDMCLGMASDTVRVIDASGSSIVSRETALKTLALLANPGQHIEGMLVYVPAKAPSADTEKQVDPFYVFAVCGSAFPEKESDDYINICLKAKPDSGTQIRRIFSENPNPAFSLIDALDRGTGWPTLETLLHDQSPKNIMLSILAPTPDQQKALQEHNTWVTELRELLSTCLGMRLVTKGNTWPTIAKELWIYILFSDFAFALTATLPDALVNVPKAPPEAKPLVLDICESLRNDRRTQSIYVDKADKIEVELNLQSLFKDIKELGKGDTFPVNESHLLNEAIENFVQGEYDAVRALLKHHAGSVWVMKGESQAQWQMIESALNMCEACDDHERQLTEYSSTLDSLVGFYMNSLREVDRLQREFEQAIGEYAEAHIIMGKIINRSRKSYRKLSLAVHDIFIRHFLKGGWPPAGGVPSSDTFDRFVAPKLRESGYRVAYILIDALRYELGVALNKLLSEDGNISMTVTYGQLPSITVIGMASLLPEARQKLVLQKSEDTFVPMIENTKLANVVQRMGLLSNRYGTRFAETTLQEFIQAKRELPSSIDLLVIRSKDMDTLLEADPETTIGQIQDILKKVRVAVNKLRENGFHEVVIATDHGFYLNLHVEAGDVCIRPTGNWVNAHDRMLLGSGSEDSSNFIIKAEKVGLRGDFVEIAGPRSLVTYRSGDRYLHGGVSLQECILPVLSMKLTDKAADYSRPNVVLSYKSGAKRITTRLPVVEVLLGNVGMFSHGAGLEILLEAKDKKGNVRGEAKAGGPVNPSTGTIMLTQGEPVQIAMKMQTDFEGKFTLEALNPTNMVAYAKLELETDYVG